MSATRTTGGSGGGGGRRRSRSRAARKRIDRVSGLVALGLLLIVVFGGLFGCFVWPTLWSYYDQGGMHYRVNRINRSTQILLSDGWSNE